VPYDNRAVNRRGYHHVAGASRFISLPSGGQSTMVPVIFSRNILIARRRLELAHLTGFVLGNG
jgi:hypothetical protein